MADRRAPPPPKVPAPFIRRQPPKKPTRRLINRYGGEATRQRAINTQVADRAAALRQDIESAVAPAKERPSLRREWATIQRRTAILNQGGPLSIKEIMTVYPKVDPAALAKAEKMGVSFASRPEIMLKGWAGQYDPLKREVGLTSWAGIDVFAHEFGAHAQQHVNPLETLGKLPLKTAMEQLPYSGIGYPITPTIKALSGNPLSYAEDPREKLAWTAQGTPYGGIDTQKFYGWMYRGGQAPFGTRPTTYGVQGIQGQPR